MTIAVLRYGEEHRARWDGLVDEAKNGLFLFNRAYMEYHADRFVDRSILAIADGEVIALLPASVDSDAALATSHGGLTFGGVLLKHALRGDVAIRAVDALLDGLRDWGVRELEVRLLPPFLASYPAAEVDYALWRRGFAIVRRDLSSALPLNDRLPLNSSKKQAVAKASKAGLKVGTGAIEDFHALLISVLGHRHGVAPVHSLADLQMLSKRFSAHITLRSVEQEGQTIAAVLVYRYPTAWHTQYMAASEKGRSLGALDLIIANLIDEATASGVRWISFGTSTVDHGRTLNGGLLWQKESFGARSVTHDFVRGTL